jgi:hypothetical protein
MSARTADAMRRVDRKFFISRQDLGLPQAALSPLLSRLHPNDPAYLVCASRARSARLAPPPVGACLE